MNTRTKSVGILVGMLLVGALLGSVVTGAVYQKRMDQRASIRTPGGFMEHVRSSVHPLSDEEWMKIRPIVEQTGRRNREIMDNAHRQMKAAFDSMLVALQPMLNEKQIRCLKKGHEKMRHHPPGPDGPPGEVPEGLPPPPPGN